MIKEDLKTVRGEFIKKGILDEYGKNSLKIEQLEKELKKYSYNKLAVSTSFVVSILTMILSFSILPPIISIPTFILTPLITTTSTLLGIATERITNKLTKSNNKYKLFQKTEEIKKLEEEKMNKEIKKEQLLEKNNVMSKSLDILKGDHSFYIKNKFDIKKGYKELNKNASYNVLKYEEQKEKKFTSLLTPENFYSLALGFGSLFGGVAIMGNVSNVIRIFIEFLSITLSSGTLIAIGPAVSDYQSSTKLDILKKLEVKKNISKSDNKDITLDLALEEIKQRKNKVIKEEKNNMKKKKNEKPINYYKKKAFFIDKARKKKQIQKIKKLNILNQKKD